MTFEEAIGQLKCNVEGDYINLDDLEAFNLAIPALEKQIPKKPSKTDKARCIHCGCVVKRDERFCKNCGQALKWRDNE